jgi:hypothetical protein
MFGFKTSETSGLQNDSFTKRQVFKTSGCKKTSIYILYLWLVESAGSVAAMVAGCVFFLYFRGFFAIYHHNR